MLKKHIWIGVLMVALLSACGTKTKELETAQENLDSSNKVGLLDPGDPNYIEFVSIGNVGNPGDTGIEANPSGCGAVDYNYRLGKYEITNAQWDAFVSAAGAPTGNPSYAYDGASYWAGAQRPANRVSWYEAAQFCNWLTSGDKSLGAYQLGVDESITVDHNAALSTYGVIYVIPTEEEWYKAAYYTGSGYSLYANGVNTIPAADNGWNYIDGSYSSPWDVGTGTMEQSGTFDMMGNVWEWTETAFDSFNFAVRGGVYNHNFDNLESSFRNYLPPSDWPAPRKLLHIL